MTAQERGTGHGERGHMQTGSGSQHGIASVFHWPLRVYFEDTDAGGVVYHANYLRFMERARTEWLRARGFEQDDLRTRFGILFVVAGIAVQYRRAARFNMQLDVSAAISAAGRASMTFRQEIRETNAEGALMCEADVRVACVDAKQFRPCPVPDEIVSELTA